MLLLALREYDSAYTAWKRCFLKDLDLLLILDKDLAIDKDLCKIAKNAIRGGVRFIQLRDKSSSDSLLLKEAIDLKNVTAESGCTLIINDRPDIAMISGVGGVHLGQDDISLRDARKLMGSEKIIGVSTHNLEQALKAESDGADYIGVGPIFHTGTKPHLKAIGTGIVEKVVSAVKIPAFFIGGIDSHNIDEILEKGGAAVAVASYIINSDDTTSAAGVLADKLKQNKSKGRNDAIRIG